MWLAGGAVKGGTIYGATDDFGFKAVEKPVHVHDIHATILYLMGIDHKKLTYRYSGTGFPANGRRRKVLHDFSGLQVTVLASAIRVSRPTSRVIVNRRFLFDSFRSLP